MKERLNLTIDSELLNAMKVYAASKEISVSELVESYFRSVTRPVLRRNILNMVDELEMLVAGAEEGQQTAEQADVGQPRPPADPSKPSFAELMSRLEVWASQPGPLTKAKKRKHGF